VVTEVAPDGSAVRLDAFGDAWVTADRSAGPLEPGERVYALQQGPVVVACGTLSGAGSVPVGVVAPYAGVVAPGGWLLCEGQELAVVDYPALHAVVGSSFGAASTGMFRVPNLANRVPLGAVPLARGAVGGGQAVTTGSGSGTLPSYLVLHYIIKAE
jgi:hypothetical protein